jgi:aryl-alcohol dehydrogenase
MIEVWRMGKLPLEKLVTTYSLNDINEAEQDAARGAVVKAVLVPNHSERSSSNG